MRVPVSVLKGGDYEKNSIGTRHLPGLVGTRICNLQVGRRGQEARWRRAQELHDQMREGCGDDLRGGLQAEEPRRCGKNQPYEEVRRRRGWRHIIAAPRQNEVPAKSREASRNFAMR